MVWPLMRAVLCRARAAGLALGAALLFAALACAPGEVDGGRHPVRIGGVVHRVGDDVIAEPERIPALSAAFSSLRTFTAAPLDHRGAALGADLWYQEQPARDGGRDLYLQAQIEVPSELRGTLGPVIHATVLLERSDADEASLDDDVIAAAGRAFAVLETRFALGRGNHDAVRSLLGAEDPELVILALEWIREHSPATFARDVAPLLAHEDERVSTLAVECLGYADDPGYARLVIHHARPMLRNHTREVYRALARLRGSEALGYLRFAAANEDDEALREEAERSLRHALTGIPSPSATGRVDAQQLARGHR